MPYLLKVENTSGYAQDCHFCGNYMCRQNCPLPFSTKETVLDMLHKVGAEDNISFYNNKKGKSDFILNLVWHKDFDKVFQKHLSSVNPGIVKNASEEEESETKHDGVSIDDCF